MDKVHEVLTRGVEQILPDKKGLASLMAKRKIKIYIGADPTAPQLHIGHSTNFLILKRLQDLGHKIIILIGDFTGMVGDPTGKETARKPLTDKEIKENMRNYLTQIYKILSKEVFDVKMFPKSFKPEKAIR